MQKQSAPESIAVRYEKPWHIFVHPSTVFRKSVTTNLWVIHPGKFMISNLWQDLYSQDQEAVAEVEVDVLEVEVDVLEVGVDVLEVEVDVLVSIWLLVLVPVVGG